MKRRRAETKVLIEQERSCVYIHNSCVEDILLIGPPLHGRRGKAEKKDHGASS